MNNIKVASINITLKDLFRKWLEITRLFHKLTDQEISILALILYYYHTYKKDITNDKILWKIVFDYDTKHLIKEELNIKDQGIQNVLSSLRKKGIIRNNKVLATYIPELEEGSHEFKIVFNFNIIYE